MNWRNKMDKILKALSIILVCMAIGAIFNWDFIKVELTAVVLWLYFKEIEAI
jgi:hypothetical protein